MNMIIKIHKLLDWFKPTVTIYINDKKVDKLPKEYEKKFKKMDEMFEDMDKMFDKFNDFFD